MLQAFEGGVGNETLADQASELFFDVLHGGSVRLESR